MLLSFSRCVNLGCYGSIGKVVAQGAHLRLTIDNMADVVFGHVALSCVNSDSDVLLW